MHYLRQTKNENARMHEATRKNIRTYLEANDMSEAALAEAAGISQSQLNRFLAGKTSDLAFTLIQNIAAAMGMSVSGLIGEWGSGPYDRKTLIVLRAMEHMSEEKKDAVVAVSSALQSPNGGPGEIAS